MDSSQVYKFATLNLSSVRYSPYQFFQPDHQDLALFLPQFSSNFSFFATQQFPNFNKSGFDWKISTLDGLWKSRFSPIYSEHCGVGKENRMMNESGFIAEWKRQCQQIKNYLKEEFSKAKRKANEKITTQEIQGKLEEQIKRCCVFDLICYKSLIKTLYGVQNIEQIDLCADKYKKIQKQHFSYLRAVEKSNLPKVKIFIQQQEFDIVCLQECSQQALKYMQNQLINYSALEMGKGKETKQSSSQSSTKSAILLKKQTFPKVSQEVIQKNRAQFLLEFGKRIKNIDSFSNKIKMEGYKYLKQKYGAYENLDPEDIGQILHKQLSWNNQTQYIVVDNLLIFSTNFKENKELLQDQQNQLKDKLTSIVVFFPEKNFILSGSLYGNYDNQINLSIQRSTFIKISCVPFLEDFQCTIHAKKTYAQPLRELAELEVKTISDNIMTDMKVNNFRVVDLKNKEITKDQSTLIPNSRHNFLHYFVTSQIEKVGRIESVSPLRRKKHVSLSVNFEHFHEDNVKQC